MRRGPWKLVYYVDSKKTELFDLAADPAELKDVAGEQSAQVGALRNELLRWIDETTK